MTSSYIKKFIFNRTKYTKGDNFKMIYKDKFRVGVDVGGTNTDICAIN